MAFLSSLLVYPELFFRFSFSHYKTVKHVVPPICKLTKILPLVKSVNFEQSVLVIQENNYVQPTSETQIADHLCTNIIYFSIIMLWFA